MKTAEEARASAETVANEYRDELMALQNQVIGNIDDYVAEHNEQVQEWETTNRYEVYDMAAEDEDELP